MWKTFYSLILNLRVEEDAMSWKRVMSWSHCLSNKIGGLSPTFELIIDSNAQKQMVKFGFGRKFHYLKYVELGILFHICLIHYKLKGIIKYRQLTVLCSSIIVCIDIRQWLVQQHLLAHHLHCIPKYVYFLNKFWQRTLLGFVNNESFKTLYDIFYTSQS